MVTDADVLSVEGYTLDYVTRAGAIRALDSVDLRIARGEVVGLVGESGSGKTSLAWAIMRALAPNAVEIAGSLKLSGRAPSARSEEGASAWSFRIHQPHSTRP
jgi:peptide/nickel transport system ATP-binding protein